jgi:hypothetical protein
MMAKRTKRYFLNKTATSPMRSKEEVYNHPDPKIDLDFPGFPHGQSKPQLINPKTEEQKKTAATEVKDGEKTLQHDQ